MQRIVVGIMTLFLLVGCQSSQPLPYAAGDEGAARFIRADYVQIGSKIQVILDASAYKVGAASIARSNGKLVQPLAIQRPQNLATDFSSIGATSSGFVGSGSSSVPNRGIQGGGNSIQSKTYIWFDMISLGDPPWELKLNMVGIGELSIELPAKVSTPDESMQTPTPKQAN